MEVLEPGRPLAEELFRVLKGMDLTSGMAELMGGTLGPIDYCIPLPGDGGRQVGYSESRMLERAQLILGAATLGTRGGQPWMHTHCVWVAPGGALRSGHLWPSTIVGNPPPVALVQGLPAVDLRSDDDPETLMPVFTPHHATAPQRRTVMTGRPEAEKVHDHQSLTGRTIVARVCPNEDLATAAEDICRKYGIANAVLRGGIGSLIGATFTDPNGSLRRVSGPGTEVATLVGHIGVERGTAGSIRAELTCTLVDRYGRVHAGRLTRGENPVAVTYELFVQEILPANNAGATRTDT